MQYRYQDGNPWYTELPTLQWYSWITVASLHNQHDLFGGDGSWHTVPVLCNKQGSREDMTAVSKRHIQIIAGISACQYLLTNICLPISAYQYLLTNICLPIFHECKKRASLTYRTNFVRSVLAHQWRAAHSPSTSPHVSAFPIWSLTFLGLRA